MWDIRSEQVAMRRGEIRHFVMTLVEMGGGEICPTITGDHQDRVTDYTAILMEET